MDELGELFQRDLVLRVRELDEAHTAIERAPEGPDEAPVAVDPGQIDDRWARAVVDSDRDAAHGSILADYPQG
jgi:hypothetical protein